MSGSGFHVHGPHDHELEHAAQGGHGEHGEKDKGLTAQIAVITAIIATVGAIFAYMGGATQANAGLYKNNAAIKCTDADEVLKEILTLSRDRNSIAKMSTAGVAWHKSNQGATERTLNKLLS